LTSAEPPLVSPLTTCDLVSHHPAIPLQHRPGATATLPRASTPGSDSPPPRWAPWDRAHQALPRPRSARFGAVDESRGFDHWFSFLAPSRLACGPGSSGSADPSLRCQDCSRLSPHLRGSAVLSFIRPLRRPVVGLAPHPVTRRLVAHSPARRCITGPRGRSGRSSWSTGDRRRPRPAG
jgi:hypothetical protein